MKIKEIENKGLKHSYEVIVPASNIEQTIEKELKQVGSRAKIPGFRPGKIPTVILRQRYGKSVMGDVLQRAANDAAKKIVDDKKLTPALSPDVTIKDYEEGGDLTLSISLETMPEVPKVDYSKISIERAAFEVSDEQIDESLQALAKNNRTLNPKAKSSKAAEGDIVEMDFKGYIGKEAFEGGEAKNYHLELGSGQFIPGFEDQLIGKKAGDEVTVKVPFPKDYHKKDLAGKEARFEVNIHAVKTPEDPKLDNDFAKSIGMEDIKKLREVIKQQIEQEYGTIVRNLLKKSLFDELEDTCTFDVPEKMVTMEYDSIWHQHQHAIENGAEKSDDEEGLKEEYKAIAKRRVQLGILLSNVAKEQDIQVNQQELAGAVQQQASMYPGQEKKIYEFYRDHPEHVHELRGPILEEKAVDYILEQVKLKDKKVTIEELMAWEKEASEGATKSKPKKKAVKKKAASSEEKAEKKPAAKKAPAKKAAPKKAAKK